MKNGALFYMMICIFLTGINQTNAYVYNTSPDPQMFGDQYIIFGESSVTIPERTVGVFNRGTGEMESVTVGGTLQLDPNIVYYYDISVMASMRGDSIEPSKLETIKKESHGTWDNFNIRGPEANVSMGITDDNQELFDDMLPKLDEFLRKSPAYSDYTGDLYAGASLNADYVETIGQTDSALIEKYNGTPLLYGKKIYTVQEAEEALSDGTKFHVGLTYK